MNAHRHRLCSDRISSLPVHVIETILCLLPIKEAARTSILCRDWRYKWTYISKLVFTTDIFFARNPSLFVAAIYQVLLQHKGPINEFTLDAFTGTTPYIEIDDQLLLQLSRRNTVKKLCLIHCYNLPLSVFSFRDLTHLYLRNCKIQHQPTTFDGFGSRLTTLHLELVTISKKTLLGLLSSCSILKSFTLHGCHCKIIHRDDQPTFSELFEYLHVIETLTIYLWDIKVCFGQQEPAASLLHLKYICIENMLFKKELDGCGLPFLLFFIRSFPNLEKIKIQMDVIVGGWSYHELLEMNFHYTLMVDFKLEHLSELEIERFVNSKPELEFVKIILAKSPVLKNVKISVLGRHAYDEVLKTFEELKTFPCASPGVKIIVE